MAWGLPGNTCLINPGSPTMPYGYVRILGTVGLLDVHPDPGRFELKIINIGTGDVEVSFAGPAVAPCVRGPRPRVR
jgi:hypothetical protein